MSKIEERQNEIIESFDLYEDWDDKYNYIIELAEELPLINEQYKTPEYLIDGCQSKVWIFANLLDGEMQYTADSDAIIAKGVVALLLQIVNGLTPQEVIDADFFFLDQIGLKEHLSPNRANGLISMIKQIKLYALALKTK
jgi:cysteine desulfuration protein SufE